MGLFNKIMDRIFHHERAPAAPATAPAAASTIAAPTSATLAPAPPAEPVDVVAVLTSMAGSQGGGGNWQTSIVDLLKLLHLDSDLTARKELAEELNIHAGEHGSTDQNIALHKAVMKSLSDNGGVVPDSFYA